jgi:hypothetical protein
VLTLQCAAPFLLLGRHSGLRLDTQLFPHVLPPASNCLQLAWASYVSAPMVPSGGPNRRRVVVSFSLGHLLGQLLPAIPTIVGSIPCCYRRLLLRAHRRALLSEALSSGLGYPTEWGLILFPTPCYPPLAVTLAHPPSSVEPVGSLDAPGVVPGTASFGLAFTGP